MAKKNPFIVEPDDLRIDLTWSDAGEEHAIWIRVKRELSVGEHRRMMRNVSTISQPLAQQRGGQAPPAEAKLEWTEYSFARMVAYITDWSLAHSDDAALRLPAKRESYEKLHQSLFDLIDGALDQHETSMREVVASDPTSPAPTATSR